MKTRWKGQPVCKMPPHAAITKPTRRKQSNNNNMMEQREKGGNNRERMGAQLNFSCFSSILFILVNKG